MKSAAIRILHIGPELALRSILIALSVLFLALTTATFFDVAIPPLACIAGAAAVWIPMTTGLYRRAGEGTFRRRPRLERREKMRRWAAALWTRPLVLLFPLWLGLFYDPSMLVDHSGMYLVFFGLPFAAAAILYRWAAGVDAGARSGLDARRASRPST